MRRRERIRPSAPLIAVHHLNNSRSQRVLWMLEELRLELAERPWFAGDEFTAADVQMSFPLEASAARGGMEPRYPLLTHLLQRMQARPDRLNADPAPLGVRDRHDCMKRLLRAIDIRMPSPRPSVTIAVPP